MSLSTADPHAIPVVVLPISDTEWRISDPRRRSDDASTLIGFIQEVEGLFETTEIGHPSERHYYSSLDDAVSSLSIARE